MREIPGFGFSVLGHLVCYWTLDKWRSKIHGLMNKWLQLQPLLSESARILLGEEGDVSWGYLFLLKTSCFIWTFSLIYTGGWTRALRKIYALHSTGIHSSFLNQDVAEYSLTLSSPGYVVGRNKHCIVSLSLFWYRIVWMELHCFKWTYLLKSIYLTGSSKVIRMDTSKLKSAFVQLPHVFYESNLSQY